MGEYVLSRETKRLLENSMWKSLKLNRARIIDISTANIKTRVEPPEKASLEEVHKRSEMVVGVTYLI